MYLVFTTWVLTWSRIVLHCWKVLLTVFSMILPRILHTTVLGLSFRQSNIWTHKMCRRDTALTHIRWSIAVIFRQDSGSSAFWASNVWTDSLFTTFISIISFVWDLNLVHRAGQSDVIQQECPDPVLGTSCLARGGLNRAIITERKCYFFGVLSVHGCSCVPCTDWLFRRIGRRIHLLALQKQKMTMTPYHRKRVVF